MEKLKIRDDEGGWRVEKGEAKEKEGKKRAASEVKNIRVARAGRAGKNDGDVDGDV